MDEQSESCGNFTEKEIKVIDFVGYGQNVKMSDIAAELGAPVSTITCSSV